MNDPTKTSDSSSSELSPCGTPGVVSNGIERRAQHEYKKEVVKDMAIDKMREKMDTIVQNMEKNVKHQLDLLVDDLVNEVKIFNLRNYELRKLFRDASPSSPVSSAMAVQSTSHPSDRRRRRVDGKLPEKEFLARNSLLTDLFEVKHIKTIYHIFIVILIIMFLNTAVHDFVDRGNINLGLRPIITGFGKFHIGLLLWGCMQLSAFSIYPCYTAWAYIHRINKSEFRKIGDVGFTLGFIVYQCLFITLVIRAVLHYNLPPATSIAVLMEMTRFAMKIHAFVRSNVARSSTSSGKASSEDKPAYARTVPAFSKFAYFLFAPTLVYRDEYPRSKRIRWSVVFRHALEVLGVIFYISFIFERFLSPLFNHFGHEQITTGNFVLTLFSCILPGSLSFLCGFYCLLHAWMNGAAEMFRFADRMFYRDWWNASSFPEYMRSWNVVVHDWLYTYVYKDSVEHLFKNCRPLATVLVFTVSAVFHEVILGFAFRFFYPVMFVQFEFMGLLLMFVMRNVSKDVGNILIWLTLCVGNGIHLSLYNMEYYARRNCPISGASITDYMIPVSWSCNGISHNPNWTITAPWNMGS
ncbi:sterol O-acyltransferase 1 isoform X2 [Malaya genurostris]|uniref:sterol O-acyltransferase 1 isoform X2 n=1 Tax=Malaya genurostris TaxID=325434 RepID=UPI0026F396A5|nr:sterol O-acyltransferase 1 isoform X2 [Malaya genurostris]